MSPRIKNLINVMVTGIVVTIIFSLVLFWCRYICYSKLIKHTPSEFFRVSISPSGLVPGEPAPQREWSGRMQRSREEPNEPNFLFSEVYASLDFDRVLNFVYPIGTIGFLWDLTGDIRLYRDVNERIYYWYDVKTGGYCCFDKQSGLIVNCYGYRGNAPRSKKIELFAGPNGVSGTPEPSLGRFYDPIVGENRYSSRVDLYDKQMRRFYKIDFLSQSIRKGPELSEGDGREPVAMGRISKNRLVWFPQLEWFPPRVKDINGNWEDQRMLLLEGNKLNEEWRYEYFLGYTDRRYTSVLNKDGRIYVLDTNEWSMKNAGYLPVPRSLFSSENRNAAADERDLLGYEILPVYATLMRPLDNSKRHWRTIDVKYLGMVVACVSREGTSMAVTVFDPNGGLVYRADTGDKEWPSSEAIYGKGWDSFWVPVEYILENLQPPVFEVASYFSRDYFEASSGHRALFILPNSFLSMLGRADTEEFLKKQLSALLLMGPSLILSVWLAFRVRKDATLVGLSGTAKKWWTIGTIAFGLTAYITYRLTRHKEVLVTCQNCGKMRRPDMERCHRCGSKWEIPELTPPNWRICD
jgi:hypothetical protein